MKRSILALILAVSSASAEPVILYPVQDSDVYSYPGDGNPTSTSFSLGVSSTPPDSTTLHSQKSLIQFDLSSLPFPASEIGSAVLRLYVFPPDPTYGSLSPGDVHVHRQSVAWTVTATTPKWPAFQSAGDMGSFPVLAGSANQWVQHDITVTAAGWAAGGFPNHGLFLSPLTDRMSPSLNVTFASMEVPGYQPQLVITRKVPLPPLAIQVTGATVTLQWPVNGSDGWVLERADSPAGPWMPSPAQVTSAAGQWQVQTSAVATKEFFRLVK
jgi:hypothetical protein